MAIYSDDDYADARADAAADAAWDTLVEYHLDSDCPAESAGDDDCDCGWHVGNDHTREPVIR